jgi:hypothetical protein
MKSLLMDRGRFADHSSFLAFIGQYCHPDGSRLFLLDFDGILRTKDPLFMGCRIQFLFPHRNRYRCLCSENSDYQLATGRFPHRHLRPVRSNHRTRDICGHCRDLKCAAPGQVGGTFAKLLLHLVRDLGDQ